MSRIYFSLTILAASTLAFACGQKTTTTATTTTSVNGPAPKNEVAREYSVQISPAGMKAAEPAIASDDKGTLFVAWVDHSDEKNANVVLQRFDSDGKPSGERVKINPEGTKVKAWYGDTPTLAIGKDGSVYVGWNRGNDAGKGNDLVVSISHDGGKTFGDAAKVNDDEAPASHGMHSLAVDSDGRIFFAWLDERNIKKPEHSGGSHHEGGEPNSEVYFSYSEDGGKTFAQNKKLATEVCPCCKTTLQVANEGRVYAAWRQVLPGEFRHVAVAHSADNGRTFSDGVIVSDDKWQISACPVSGAALSMGDDGSVTAAWYTAGSDGQAGIYSARSTDGGATFSPRVLISNDATNGTPVILKDHSFVLPAKDANIMIKNAGDSSREVSLSEALYPAAAMSRDGKFVCFVRKGKEGSSVWLSRVGS